MKKQIGKYIVHEDESNFTISYSYTLVDFVGMLWMIPVLVLGYMFLCVGASEGWRSYTSWVFGLLGAGFELFVAYLLISNFYNSKKGLLRIDKKKRELTIVDFLEKETIPFAKIKSVKYKVETIFKPFKATYGQLYIKLKDGSKKDCLQINGSYLVDYAAVKTKQELHSISQELIDRINEIIG